MKKAVFAELLTIFLWTLGHISIAHLSLFFDAYTQNLFRYISAAISLLLISMLFNRDNYLSSFKKLRTLSIPIITVFIFQIFNVYGVVFTTPTVAILITRLSIPLTDVLSFFLFPEEKGSLSNKGFLVGTVMSFAGISGVILLGPNPFRSGETFLMGVVFLLLASIFWAFYMVSIKIALNDIDALSATVNVFLFSGLMYLPLSILTGGIYGIFKVELMVNLLLVASGILAIGLANLLNYYAIQGIGASMAANLQILLPIFIGIMSVIVFGEDMPPHKIFFSILTLIGCWFIIRTSDKTDVKIRSS